MDSPTPTQPTTSVSGANADFATFVAIDWADTKHTVHMQKAGSTTVSKHQIEQTPEALSQWFHNLLAQFPGKKVAVILEGNRSGLLYHLLNYPALVIHFINPKAAAKYREAIHPNGSKTDPIDADLLLDFLRHHRERLRVWVPDTVETRTLGQMAEDRRTLVDLRTRLLNSLTASLKQVFPQALQLFENITTPMVVDFLQKWPSLEKAKKATPTQLRRFFLAHHSRRPQLIEQRLQIIERATPLTNDPMILTTATMMIEALVLQIQKLHQSIGKYDQRLLELTQAHSKAPVFQSLPGAGKAMVPRLISALGTQPDRWPDADDILRFCGVAPVEIGSGKQYKVIWRWNCPRFLRQTFVEFAGCSILQCAWARAYYEQQKTKGKKHHQALRALAFKWIRIIWKCWKTNTPYDESIYLRSLERKHSPLVAKMNEASDLNLPEPGE